ncbi:pyrroline-5-carboxylate reductase [Robertmurraya korlensis]|uniref:pyrroline-5-carboxylate reductase n=1 Tax=Robertmurraya korlensis TaxID=519977 RepID=UPI00203D958F|nr:pyrroline-5-carboxylate reductase [Robertmurraya korlensis]
MGNKIGFIGCGKMGQAILMGLTTKSNIERNLIRVSAKTETTLTKVKELFGVQTTTNNKDIGNWADIIVIAVKPDLHKEVIEEIRAEISSNTILVTIAAGISLQFLEQAFGRPVKVVRAMPNTPSLVGEGMTALCFHELVLNDERVRVSHIFESLGQVEVFPESLMNSIPAISGSSPAYVYMMIEALADGAVKQGIARDKAYKMAAQAVLGAAKMVLETGLHPGVLKDQVCTPGGATIEAVAALEETGFRASILSAMESCTEKVIKLTENQ